MPVEQREQVTHVRWSQRETGGTPCLDGRRQPSLGGTSRMNREIHVRICGRLGVKFPGPTRRCPVQRRHESGPGFRTELENRVGDGQGKGTSGQNHEAESTEAPIRGALPRMSEEAG